MILCCGEALIDMLPREAQDGSPAFAPFAGGAIFNSAIALGRLGAPVALFTGLSTDLFGEILVRELENSRVETGRLARSDRPTTLAFVTLTDGQAKYAFYDENTAGRMLDTSHIPELSSDIDALLFGGISLIAEPGAETYAALAARAAGDKLVMLDPNIRAGFVQDEARYRARLDAMLAGADVVKLSDEDMDWLGTDPEALFAMGVAVVLITRGAEGVDAITPEGTRRIGAEPAQVVDTVGAGDTFNAGFLAGLHKDGLLTRAALRDASLELLTPAVALGTKAAAITVSRAGANPPWESEL
ncbi:fructokinase [Roseivivax halotolerans]|uniref:Fructokinase n=1 Tax=Roseivivax halotolerans TaxID=93684 RepID=A0A1I5UNB5_9RHOB|nr:carbohydrate kinase [Roseivivax halotolerans]SFP96710.1 fructokinase [Roseivivax halotolerans]